jgi:hypothetical protein
MAKGKRCEGKKSDSCKYLTAVICTCNRVTRIRRKGLKKWAGPERLEKKMTWFAWKRTMRSSVVDPDPSDLKLLEGARSEQLRIRKEFEVKLLWKTDHIWRFLNKNAQFINKNSFLSKKYSRTKLVIMHNLTHLQDGIPR